MKKKVERPMNRNPRTAPSRWLDRLAEASVVGSFSKLGYWLRAPSFAPLPSMVGQRVLVTGATSGLGLAAAKQLVQLGAEVILVGRSEEKLHAARATSGAQYLECCDLSNLDDVRRLAARLREKFSRLHGVVHNAGVLLNHRERTPQGFEVAFATHLLSPFLLTCELLPILRALPAGAGPGTRIVWVSSGGMYTQHFRQDRCEALQGKYDGVVAYAQQKRGQVLLQRAMQQKSAPLGISHFAMHPGWADTPGVARSLPRFYQWTRPLLRTPDEGADTIAWLLASEDVAGLAGGFFLDRAPRPTERSRRFRHHEADGQGLLARCAELTHIDWDARCEACASIET